MSGYFTNYGANALVMSQPKPVNFRPGPLRPYEGLKKFTNFKYPDRIGILFETGHSMGHIIGWYWPSGTEPRVAYVHNEQMNTLFLNGEVRNFKRIENADTIEDLIDRGNILLVDP